MEYPILACHSYLQCSELSCSSEKASGLLLLIAKRCCQAHQLSWRVVAPGRLLHCRLHIASKPIDILGIYQYPWNTSVAQRNRRQSIWVHLRDTLQALPQRNILCVLGDFNCSLPSIDRLVGTPNFRTSNGRQSGPQHGDMATFACLLQGFQLTALNNWLASHGDDQFELEILQTSQTSSTMLFTSDNNAWMLSGRTHCTGRNVRME